MRGAAHVVNFGAVQRPAIADPRAVYFSVVDELKYALSADVEDGRSFAD